MKLYAVTLETEIYCLADSPQQAMEIADRHKHDEEYSLDAREASWVEGDWVDCIPYTARGVQVEQLTCKEWLDKQEKSE